MEFKPKNTFSMTPLLLDIKDCYSHNLIINFGTFRYLYSQCIAKKLFVYKANKFEDDCKSVSYFFYTVYSFRS